MQEQLSKLQSNSSLNELTPKTIGYFLDISNIERVGRLSTLLIFVILERNNLVKIHKHTILLEIHLDTTNHCTVYSKNEEERRM